MKNEFTVEKLLLINKELEDENEILKLSIKDLKYKVDVYSEENNRLQLYINKLLKNRIKNFCKRCKNIIRRK